MPVAAGVFREAPHEAFGEHAADMVGLAVVGTMHQIGVDAEQRKCSCARVDQIKDGGQRRQKELAGQPAAAVVACLSGAQAERSDCTAMRILRAFCFEPAAVVAHEIEEATVAGIERMREEGGVGRRERGDHG